MEGRTLLSVLDPSFDRDGKVTVNFSGLPAIGSTADDATATKLTTQSDGKILLLGKTSVGSAGLPLTRLKSDGSLDVGFGVNGITTIKFPGVTRAVPVGILQRPDTRIMVIAADPLSDTKPFLAARLFPNGTIDTSYDVDGMIALGFGEESFIPQAATMLPDGKLLAAGVKNRFGGSLRIARLAADGLPDLSFDDNGAVAGKFQGAFFGTETVSEILVQPDGRFVLTGHSTPTTFFPNYDFAAARFFATGIPDKSFGVDGVRTIDLGSAFDIGLGAALDSRGYIVIAGASGGQFTAVRLTSLGALDPTFGDQGVSRPTSSLFAAQSGATAVAVQRDDKVLLVGDSSPQGTGFTDFLVARLQVNGRLDPSFDSDGVATFGFDVAPAVASNPNVDRVNAAKLQPDGKLLVAGFSRTLKGTDFAVARVVLNSGRTPPDDPNPPRPDPPKINPPKVDTPKVDPPRVKPPEVNPPKVRTPDPGLPPAIPPIHVSSVKNASKRFHKIAIALSGRLKGTRAFNPRFSSLSMAGRDGRFDTSDDQSLRITSVRYIAASNVVYLTTKTRHQPGAPIRLTLDPEGILSDRGLKLDGDGDGNPGGVFSLVIA